MIDSANPRAGDTYTATEDCFVFVNLATNGTDGYTNIELNGQIIAQTYSGSNVTIQVPYVLPLKKGDVITFSAISHESTWYKVFKMS